MMFNGLMLANVHFSHDKSSLHTDFSASPPHVSFLSPLFAANRQRLSLKLIPSLAQT